ncbi:hypothetical protein [Effusibacillus lacus]|uniref:hypothetical protein n=1 Tax=Effusibacillus lacus TaxID=1348429 RepID=UPI000BB81CFD|nr:hypothetical protein [Effusibacillus lacus]TCS70522.1 hypothetical protein EDD64_13253 [Effusibacillus lacus]
MGIFVALVAFVVILAIIGSITGSRKSSSGNRRRGHDGDSGYVGTGYDNDSESRKSWFDGWGDSGGSDGGGGDGGGGGGGD